MLCLSIKQWIECIFLPAFTWSSFDVNVHKEQILFRISWSILWICLFVFQISFVFFLSMSKIIQMPRISTATLFTQLKAKLAGELPYIFRRVLLSISDVVAIEFSVHEIIERFSYFAICSRFYAMHLVNFFYRFSSLHSLFSFVVFLVSHLI